MVRSAAVLLFVSAIVFAHTDASAEMLSGVVSGLDGHAKTVTLRPAVDDGQAPTVLSVKELTATKKGIGLLDRIEIGDIVQADVKKSSDGRLEVKSLKKVTLKADAKSAADKPGQYLVVPEKSIKDTGKRSSTNPLTFEMK